MTINSEVRVAGPFDGNDATTVFPFAFKVFATGELYVVRATNSIETVLALGADYTVALNADQNAAPGGSVTLAGPLASGSTLTLTSALQALQPTDLTNQGGFYPKVINNALDRLTILAQQLKAVVGRTLKFPISDGAVGDLPGRGARAGRVLAFHETTGEPVAGPATTAVNTVAGAAAAVQTVAGNIADVNTVAGNIADVNTVAGAAAAVQTVAGNIADVNTVAGNIADVNTVAGNIADVTNFAGVYYGPSATDPTTRRDGSALQQGDLYFNTTGDGLRVYSPFSGWVSLPLSVGVSVSNYSGDGVTTTFTLPFAPVAENNTQVFISGVYQQKSGYSVVGSSIVFDSPPPAGSSNVEVLMFSVAQSDEGLRTDLSNPADPIKGARLVWYTNEGEGAVARPAYDKLIESKSILDYGGDRSGSADSTAAAKFLFGAAQTPEFPMPGGYKVGLFNTNGSPVSNVAATNSYWNRKLLPYESYIQNRLSNLQAKTPKAAVKGLLVGNSVAVGTGSSGSPLSTLLQFRLRDYYNLAGTSYASYEVKNRGIGSTNIAYPAMVLADGASISPSPVASGVDYAILICTRNDVTQIDAGGMTIGTYARLIENALSQLVAKGIEPIMILEPPAIDISTGDIAEGASMASVRQVVFATCGQYGVTLIDGWRYFSDLKQRFGLDLRQFMSDAVHPNQHGYNLLGDMLFEAITRIPGEVPMRSHSAGSNWVASYYDLVPTAGQTTLAPVTGLSARRFIKGDASSEAITLNSGQSTSFTCKVSLTGILIEYAPGTAGTITVSIAGINMASGIALNNTGGGGGSLVKEIIIFSSAGNWRYDGTLTVSCTSGTVMLQSVAYISDDVVSSKPVPVGAQTGTWSAATLSNGDTAISSATIGDSFEFEMIGDSFSMRQAASGALGKFEVYLDGALLETVDSYLVSAETTKLYRAWFAEGRHTLKFVVVEKNPSSTGNTIKIGGFKMYSSRRLQQRLVHLPAGASTLTVVPREARVNQGTPVRFSLAGNSVTAQADCILDVLP